MRDLTTFPMVHLCRDLVDGRKRINGLASFVEKELSLNPLEDAVFVFCSKARDTVSILYFDKTGFALWQKRLEKEKFHWPRKFDQTSLQPTVTQLKALLEGFEIFNQKPHQILAYSSFS